MSRRDEVLACHAAGLTATEAARKLGLPRGSVRHHWPKAGDAPALPDPAPEAGGPSMPEPFHESYEPFTIDGGPVGLLSDPHIPYHDMATIKGWVDECVRMAVKTIFLNGDVLDFYQLSDFMRDPAMPRMREEILKGRQFLEYLRSRFPRARIVYKEGNHDERLERYLANLAPELLGLAR